MPDSLFERIGGNDTVGTAVDIFYTKVMSDDHINDFFEDIDMLKQIRKMQTFLSHAFGADAIFRGESMRSAHKRLVKQGLNDSHFNAVKNHIQSTLKELNVAQPLIDEVLHITESTRKDVLNK